MDSRGREAYAPRTVKESEKLEQGDAAQSKAAAVRALNWRGKVATCINPKTPMDLRMVEVVYDMMKSIEVPDPVPFIKETP